MKRGTQNKSGHEARDDVDSGVERIMVLSPEQNEVSSGALVCEKEKLFNLVLRLAGCVYNFECRLVLYFFH